ncbi:MAG TPA: urease accessory UreF family protein [Ktedonobacteraceae bacterium]
MEKNALAFLRLLQLADSALPIGTAAHSFGLETLVAQEWLRVEELERFLRAYLAEVGVLEGTFCLRGQQLGTRLEQAGPGADVQAWLLLNARLSAFKLARESREASAALGRRLLQLASGLELHPGLPELIRAAKAGRQATHHSIAFGLLGGLLQIEARDVVLAYFQQTLTGLVSACQRLLPLGQSRASQILWHLHPIVLETVERSEAAALDDNVASFTALVDLGSMLHPALTTRLFIS